MKHIILLSMIIGSLLWSDTVEDKFGQQVPSSFETDIKEVKKMRLFGYAEYNPKKAVEISLKMVTQKPDYYRGYYNLALAYFTTKEYDKSKESFDKALKIRKEQKIDDATIFNSAGWAALKVQDYKRAEMLLLHGVELKDRNSKRSNAALFSNVGDLYFYTQRFEEANKYLTIARDSYGSTSVQTTIDSIKEISKQFLYICYKDKHKVENNQYKYNGCVRREKPCSSTNEEHFGQYPSDYATTEALARCNNLSPKL